MKPEKFQIITGPVEYGSSTFTVSVYEKSWSCTASYISTHPLNDLIYAAVELYNHISIEPLPVNNSEWEICAADEPGGIVLKVIPVEKNVKILIYEYFNEMWPSPQKQPDIAPVSECIIDYWSFAEAVVQDAGQVIAKQGFLGMRNGWEPHRWDIDARFQVLPIEHFLHLYRLVKYREEKPVLNLQEEIDLLKEIQTRHLRK